LSLLAIAEDSLAARRLGQLLLQVLNLPAGDQWRQLR
jgi:hypothetical protein